MRTPPKSLHRDQIIPPPLDEYSNILYYTILYNIGLPCSIGNISSSIEKKRVNHISAPLCLITKLSLVNGFESLGYIYDDTDAYFLMLVHKIKFKVLYLFWVKKYINKVNNISLYPIKCSLMERFLSL